MPNQNEVEIISKSKILLVEGKDEIHFFDALLAEMGLQGSIQVIETQGITKLTEKISGIKVRSGYKIVQSIGIVRDADSDSTAAFQSVCSSLNSNDLPTPQDQLVTKTEPGKPQVTVLIIPYGKQKGMLENVCLESVEDDPAMECVDNFFSCLTKKNLELSECNIPKARVRTFLASREWLEIAFFEGLQDCLSRRGPIPPKSPAIASPRVHTFLSSRYTPELTLGAAAGKNGPEDRYWNFDHPCFDSIKNFLRMI